MQLAEIIVFIVIPFLIIWIFGSLVLWLAGRVVSGGNAKFTDALIISLLGAIINTALTFALDLWVLPLLPPGWELLGLVLPLIIILIVYIWLIMRFFDTGVAGALAVGILYIIFMIIILIILGFIAVMLLFLLLPFFP